MLCRRYTAQQALGWGLVNAVVPAQELRNFQRATESASGTEVVISQLGRVLASEIWGISAHDPLTLAAVIALLTSIGVVACYLPSRRATRVDPMEALRYE